MVPPPQEGLKGQINAIRANASARITFVVKQQYENVRRGGCKGKMRTQRYKRGLALAVAFISMLTVAVPAFAYTRDEIHGMVGHIPTRPLQVGERAAAFTVSDAPFMGVDLSEYNKSIYTMQNGKLTEITNSGTNIVQNPMFGDMRRITVKAADGATWTGWCLRHADAWPTGMTQAMASGSNAIDYAENSTKWSVEQMPNTESNNGMLWCVEHAFPSVPMEVMCNEAGADYDALVREMQTKYAAQQAALTAQFGSWQAAGEFIADVYICGVIQEAVWFHEHKPDVASGKLVSGPTMLNGPEPLRKIYNYLCREREIYKGYADRVLGQNFFLSSTNENKPTVTTAADSCGEGLLYGPFHLYTDMLAVGDVNLSLTGNGTGISKICKVTQSGGRVTALTETSKVKAEEDFYVFISNSTLPEDFELSITASSPAAYTFEGGSRGRVMVPQSTMTLQDGTPMPFQHIGLGGVPRRVSATRTLDFPQFKGQTTGWAVITKTDENGDVVPNAVITVKNAGNEEVGDYVIGADGTVKVDNLAPGTYSYTEKEAPSGYVKNTGTHTFTVSEEGGAATGDLTFVNERVKAQVTLSKVDAVTNAAVPSAKLAVYNAARDVVFEGTTGSDGKLTVPNLVPGEYTFKETEAPQGYKLNAEELSFTVSGDGEVSGVTVLSNEAINVTIKKTDAATGNRVPGAVIEFFDGAEQSMGTYTTDNLGCITLEKLSPGTYKYKEKTAPEGYELNENTYTFEVAADGTVTGTTAFTNTPLPPAAGTAVIYKVGSNEEPLAKAVIVVKEVLSDAEVFRGPTDAAGKIEVPDLAVGNYSYSEVSAPEGYIKDDGEYFFEVKKDGTVVAGGTDSTTLIKIKNKPTVVRIRKEDKDTKIGLSGAEIQIRAANNTLYGPYTTDADGYVLVEALPMGSYIATETVAPEGYAQTTADFTFQVTEHNDENNPVSVVIPNSRAKVDVEFEKYDSTTGRGLAGAAFSVYDVLTNKQVAAVTSDANGKLKFQVDPGDYYIQETNAPNNYELNTKKYQFHAAADGTITNEQGDKIENLRIPNAPGSYSVTLRKYDSKTNEPLAGAVITVYNSIGRDVFSGTTDADGNLRVPTLSPGRYSYKEVEAPSGYSLNQEIFSFTLKSDGTTEGVLKMPNTPNSGSFGGDGDGGEIDLNQGNISVTITKTDSTTTASVPGAKVAIYDAGGNLVFEGITGSDGKMTSTPLKPGKYTFKETLAPDGYKLNTNAFEFIINGDKTVTGTTAFTNERQSHVVRITKTDLTTAAPVPGAKVAIYDSTGKKVYEDVTDSNGVLTSTSLAPGRYTFKETLAPAGYKLNTNSFEFTVNQDGTVTGTMAFTNVRKAAYLTKYGENNSVLAGCKVDITGANGNKVMSAVSDSNGRINISSLPAGTYHYREVAAPEKYALNPKTYSFTIKEDGSITGDVSFTDEMTVVSLKKVDGSNNPLAGATIGLYAAGDGKLLQSVITDSTGLVMFKGLTPGKYYFKELKAPSGYALSNDVIPFEMTSYWDNASAPYTMRNTKIVQTGGDDMPIAAMAAAVIAISLGVYGVIALRRRLKGEDS